MRENPLNVAHLAWATQIADEFGQRYGSIFGDEIDLDAKSLLVDDISNLLSAVSSMPLYYHYRTSQKTYSEWVSEIKRRGPCSVWDRLYDELPLLESRLAAVKRNVQSSLKELGERLRADLPLLRQKILDDSIRPVKQIRIGLSDPHRGGRTVACITFADQKKIIYKPRSLSADKVWSKFLPSVMPDLKVKVPKTIDRREYGWGEFIDDVPGEKEDLDTLFGVGAIGYILWVLNSVDMHRENIVFSRDGAAVIDCETLLSPSVQKIVDPRGYWRQHDITQSLFCSSDLTQRSSHYHSSFLSALTIKKKQKFKGRFFLGEDHVEALKDTELFEDIYLEETTPSEEHVRSVLNGFREAHERISPGALSDLVNALSESSMLRFVPRNTSEYYQILERLSSPRLLKSSGKTDQILNRMVSEAKSFDLQVLGRTSTECLVRSEINQLLEGDVPIFEFDPNDTTLKVCTGEAPGFFSQSARTVALHKIARVQDPDIREQMEHIAISCRKPKLAVASTLVSPQLHSLSDLDPKRLMSNMADLIISSAYSPTDALSRFMTTSNGGGDHGDRVVFGDITAFNGFLGIIYSLEVLSKLHNDVLSSHAVEYLDTQHSLISEWLKTEIDKEIPSNIRFGLEGVGGNIFFASQLYSMDETRWAICKPYVENLFRISRSHIEACDEPDLVGGLSGVLAATNFVRRLCSFETNNLDNFTDGILLRQETLLSQFGCEERLAFGVGAAHGWAGVAYSVFDVHSLSKNATVLKHKILEHALQGISEHFTKFSGWHDLRGRPKVMNKSWCNGSSGLIRALACYPSDFSSEVGELLKSLRGYASGELDWSMGGRYCCGNAGIIDLLVDTGRSGCSDLVVEEACLRNARGYYERCFVDDVDSSFEWRISGLYQGQASILYSVLRQYDAWLPSLAGQTEIAVQKEF